MSIATLTITRNCLVFLLLLSSFNVICLAVDFPLRDKYPNVPVYSAAQLKQDFSKVIIIDVRTKFEYSVVRMNGAKHISVAKMTFVEQLKVVRTRKSNKKIIFYCNGNTCSKSYTAVTKAKKAGFNNVYAYDAGIFAWVKQYPELASLLGQSPVHQFAIIKKKTLQAKLLDFRQFQQAASISNSLVIDIRDPRQRKLSIGLVDTKIPLDKLTNFLKRGTWKNRDLLIYDNVGRQVTWLQYLLMAHGYTRYHFLEKGARGTVSAPLIN
ncbi:hypothetical protein MNBD_GAMMA12-547 [hydrothermal vent metagenome]|uniref:Rhodanese domain-containing protein n=1 Tax=hydrothermal vent metagenome TaxID=652676 RepID=A0A3B0YXQ2_9ZZZZ